MAVYLCHEQPDLFEHETQIIDSRPGAVRLARSALHPGGGGQESDRAILAKAPFIGAGSRDTVPMSVMHCTNASLACGATSIGAVR
jgi:Ser-tRNA(Ala) deacylase AlaX